MHPSHRSPCPIARTLDLVGDKWTLLILRDALVFKAKSFAEFEQSPENIPTSLLADRLMRLVETGFLRKVPYQEKPVRHHYVATEKAKAVLPVIRAMKKFGETQLNA